MNKPYIVCYMMTSVDGRIDCDMVGQLAGVEDYYPLLEELGLQSAVSGKTTARLELAEAGAFQCGNDSPLGKETVSKKTDSSNGYTIVLDTKGTLLWKHDSEYEKPHILSWSARNILPIWMKKTSRTLYPVRIRLTLPQPVKC